MVAVVVNTLRILVPLASFALSGTIKGRSSCFWCIKLPPSRKLECSKSFYGCTFSVLLFMYLKRHCVNAKKANKAWKKCNPVYNYEHTVLLLRLCPGQSALLPSSPHCFLEWPLQRYSKGLISFRYSTLFCFCLTLKQAFNLAKWLELWPWAFVLIELFTELGLRYAGLKSAQGGTPLKSCKDMPNFQPL